MQYPRKQYMDKLIQKRTMAALMSSLGSFCRCRPAWAACPYHLFRFFQREHKSIPPETFSSSQGDTFVGSSAREGFAVSLKATDNTSQSRRSP